MNPILLLHGALGSGTQLESLKSLLQVNGHAVYTLNFSGHSGRSFENSFGIETFADDVLYYLDANKLKTVDIFGYSMGGYVALWFASQHADRVGKIIALGTKFDWSPESALHEIKKMDPEKILEKVPAFARILEHRHAPVSWKDLMSRTAAMMKKLGDAPLLSEQILSSIEKPVLILLGDKDDMADHEYSKQVAYILPQGKFQQLHNTSHPIERVDLKILQPIVGAFFKAL